MKKIMIGLAIFLALILCVLIILPFVVDINAIVAKQIPVVEKQIHRNITIGNVKLTVLTGLGAEISHVTISNNPDFKKENFVSINSLKATVQLLPLLKKQVLISSISIDKPSVLIERDANGRFNFSDMIQPKAPEKASAPKGEEKPKAENPLAALENISISKISITDGNFKFIDALKGQMPGEISLDKLNLSMKAVSLSKKIAINFDTDVYASSKAGHVSLSGNIGPIGSRLVIEDIPMDLTLALDDVNLPHLAQYVNGIKVSSGAVNVKTALKGELKDKLQCRLDVDWNKLNMTMESKTKNQAALPQIAVDGSWQIAADVSGTPKSPSASGTINLDKSAVQYGQLFDKPASTPLNVDFDVAVKEDGQDIKKIIARIGDLEATVSGNVEKGPVMDLKLQTNRFSAGKLVSFSPQTASKLPKDLGLPDSIQLSASAKGSVEDLNFKTDADLTDGKAAFGNLFQKESGTPLSLAVSGLLKKDAVKVDNLKFILSKMTLTGSADVSNFADPFINGTVNIAPTPLNALAPILPMLKSYDLKGTLALSDARFKGKVDALKNLSGVSGSLTLKDGSAASAELGKKIENIQATVNVADNAVQVRNTSLTIGPSDLSLNATIRNPVKPDITFNLESNYLDVDQLLPPSSKEKSTEEKKEAKPGEAKPGTTEAQKAPDLRAHGKASIKKCTYNKMVFENILTEIEYADAVATLKNLSFDSFGGNVKTSGKVDLTDMKTPRWNADVATKNINANNALSQFTSIQDTVYGNFTGNLSVKGKGSEWQVISKNLAGNGSADIANGRLAKINLLDAVAESLLKFKGLSALAQNLAPEKQKKLNETEFSDLSGKFAIEAGKIILDALKISAHDFTMSGTGAIGLDKSLDLDTIVLLSKTASERFVKDKTLKYLLNSNQQLEIPCAIKGDVASPRVLPDGNSLNRLLENAASGAVKEQIQKHLDDKLGKDVGKEVDKVLKNIFK